MRTTIDPSDVFRPPHEGNGECAAPNESEPVSLADLFKSHPTLREPVIDGLLRRGQVGNIISTSKSYKTFLILALAICMALKRFWLEMFQTVGGRVLIIDLELQQPDIVKRMQAIANAMHVPVAQVCAGIDVWTLRGRNATWENIEARLLQIPPRTYSLIILDPLYKVYWAEFDENSDAAMTGLYRRFERVAEHLDCAMMIVHHASKGSQNEKRTTDMGSGGSAQSRSADCHIGLREHEQEDAVVFDCRVRSFRPIEPFVLQWTYPLWERALDLDPTALKTTRKQTPKPERQTTPEPEPWTVEKFVAAFVTTHPQEKALIVARARQAGIKNRQIDDLITLSFSDKRAFHWSFPKDRTVYIATVEQPITCKQKIGVS